MRKLQGRVKSVISLVKLVVHALSRFPTMLAGEHRIKAWTVASRCDALGRGTVCTRSDGEPAPGSPHRPHTCRLLPTLKEPLLQPAHGSTLNALFLLFGILGANASREGLALFSDLVNLLEVTLRPQRLHACCNTCRPVWMYVRTLPRRISRCVRSC